MSIERLVEAGLLGLMLLLTACGGPRVSFSTDVQPILREHCFVCHDGVGEGVARSGFSVRDYESVMKGTELGPVVVAGSSMSSVLYLVVAGKTAPEIQMPPQHPEAWAEGRGIPLSEDEIGIIEAWIDEGAKNN
jgi:hypothetical protein